MSRQLSKTDRERLVRTAGLIDAEALSWSDGWAIMVDGKLEWPKDSENFHVRWLKLKLAAEFLRTLAQTKPAPQCPNCLRPAESGLFGSPPLGEAKLSVTHCGCYHEPKGGERFTAERDAEQFKPSHATPE